MSPPPCTYREVTTRALDSLRHGFVREGLKALRVPEHWPSLPMAEIVLTGEDIAQAELVRPLANFLTESLSSAATPAA